MRDCNIVNWPLKVIISFKWNHCRDKLILLSDGSMYSNYVKSLHNMKHFLQNNHNRSFIACLLGQDMEYMCLLWVSCPILVLPIHWNGNIAIFMKFVPLAALNVIILSTSRQPATFLFLFITIVLYAISFHVKPCHHGKEININKALNDFQ